MQNLLDEASLDTVKEGIMQLKVAELKNVCRSIGLPLSGRKTELQERLNSFVMAPSRAGMTDPFRIPAVNILVKKAGSGDPVPKFETLLHAITTGSFLHPVATGHQEASTLNNKASSQLIPRNNINGKPHLRFQASPFYNLKRLVGSEAAPEAPSKRGVSNISFKLNEEEIKLLKESPNIKLYLFCGINNAFGATNDVPIQFPMRNEIKFNGTQIKDNVHGLKNKVGTAKPADLTPYVNWPPKYNLLQVVYAFTKEDHAIYVYLVEVVETEELLKKTLEHPKIVRPATLQYIKQTLSEEEDEDLMTTSTVMSLQCPISYSRMKYPVKSIHCKHLQCFDAQWFIESQRQIPTWQCPVCQRTIHIEDLAICEFVQEIINSTDEEVEQVEISKDGSWVVKEEADNHSVPPNNNNGTKNDTTPEIKPEDSHAVGSSDDRHGSEPMIISLDSDEEDEIEQAVSKTTDSTAPSNQLQRTESTSSTDLNLDNDLLDDEDMAFIEELANSIIEKPPDRNQVEHNESGISNLSANEAQVAQQPIQAAASAANLDHRTVLDPRTSTILRYLPERPSPHHRAQKPAASNSSAEARNYIPNSLGRPPLNSNVPGPLPQLPSMSRLTNSDSMIFRSGHSTLNSEGSAVSEPPNGISSNNQRDVSPIFDENNLNFAGPAVQPALPPLPRMAVPPIGVAPNSVISPSPVPDPRRKKPEVSPFLPKKNYKNVLPKKRSHTNGASNPGSPPLNEVHNINSKGSSAASPSSGSAAPPNSTAPPNDSLHSDDLIDLTSD